MKVAHQIIYKQKEKKQNSNFEKVKGKRKKVLKEGKKVLK